MNKEVLYFAAAFAIIYLLLSMRNRDELIDKDSKLLTIDSSGDMIFTGASWIFDYADSQVANVTVPDSGVSMEDVETKINVNNDSVIYPAISSRTTEVETAADGLYIKNTEFDAFKGSGGYLENNFLKKSTPYSANISRASGSETAIFKFS